MIRRLRLPADVAAALPGWVTARVLVAGGIAVAAIAADELAGGSTLQLDQGLFAWDAAFYRDIADHGYDGVAREGLRFFPLLPALAWVVAGVVGNVGIGLVVVANAAALAAGALLHRLAVAETGDHGLADRAAWLLALLPPAVVLVVGYAESLLLASSIAAFAGLRSRRWWLAAGAGLLAGLSRPVGALLALPAAIEGWRRLSGAPVRERVARLAAVAAPPLGSALFLVWVDARFGSWRIPLRLQSTDDLRGDWANPLGRVVDAFGQLATGDRLGEGLHAPWIAGFALLVVVLARRWPASYTVYTVAVLVLALSAESLGSFERYGLSAFPLVLALAGLVGGPRWERPTLVAAGAGLAAFTTLVYLGTFVP